MKTLKKLAVVLVATMMLVSLTACGKKTVEDYKSTDDWKEMEKELNDAFAGQGISMDVDAKGNTVIYTCVIEESVIGDADLDEYAKSLKEYTSNMEGYYKEQIAQMEEAFKVDDIDIQVIYKVGSKTLLDTIIK